MPRVGLHMQSSPELVEGQRGAARRWEGEEISWTTAAFCLEHRDEFCYNSAHKGVNSRPDDKTFA